MKTFFSLIIILLISFCFSVGVQQDSCKNHQVWHKTINFINSIVYDKSQIVQDSIKRFANDFQNNSPSTAKSEDLGVCSQYEGEDSCCTRKMTSFIEIVALYKAKPLLKKNSIVDKFLKGLIKQMNKSTCQPQPEKQIPTSIESLSANKELEKLQTLIQNVKICKTKFAKAATQFTRGALCSICSGMNNLSNYFDNSGDLLVNQASSKQYQDAVDSSIQCFADLVSLKGQNGNIGLLDIATEVLDQYVNPECASTILQKIQTVFVNPGVSTTIVDTNIKVCTPKRIFQIQNICENAQEGDSQIDAQFSTRLLRQNEMKDQDLRKLQILSTEEDAVVISTGGANIFISSKLDADINDTGENISLKTDYDTDSAYINIFSLSFFALLLILFY